MSESKQVVPFKRISIKTEKQMDFRGKYTGFIASYKQTGGTKFTRIYASVSIASPDESLSGEAWDSSSIGAEAIGD